MTFTRMGRYQYLDSYRKCKGRPAVWMPLLAELSHEGYLTLFNACSLFPELPSFAEDNDEDTHSIAGLVSFREWRYVHLDNIAGVFWV